MRSDRHLLTAFDVCVKIKWRYPLDQAEVECYRDYLFTLQQWNSYTKVMGLLRISPITLVQLFHYYRNKSFSQTNFSNVVILFILLHICNIWKGWFIFIYFTNCYFLEVLLFRYRECFIIIHSKQSIKSLQSYIIVQCYLTNSNINHSIVSKQENSIKTMKS